MPRFTVQTHHLENRPYFSIRDNEADRWHSPEKATTLHFGDEERAQLVADALNFEWAAFLADPY